ncbi:VOC family protein [Ottowia thiooxydans]|uniref:Catechol 2,3-dioxygenase-like lactoylglutathione lyase family enzyme n=1 Tax=Ottowia thiooxydans TaxID=219182 RepID=A0ABV2Q8V3_9BURK
MTSPWIEGLRSVALNVPDLVKAEQFYVNIWHLEVAHRKENAIYLRGSGGDDHLLALYAGSEVPQVRQVTLRARSAEALVKVSEAVERAGGSIVTPVGPLTKNPAGGTGVTVRDPHGRIFQVVHGDARHEPQPPVKDIPIRLTHAVLNSHAVDETQAFIEQAFGFRLADRTGIMAFMNCDRDHHTIAIGITDNDALNHIAFLMPDMESVMRGGGRMKDAGFPIQWGPGRHGPGNNLFNYFIDPFGIVIEYTADVEQIDDSYVPRGPSDWKWPEGRYDQWGISQPPGAPLKEAQRRVFFAS